jgi:hypothetical protein
MSAQTSFSGKSFPTKEPIFPESIATWQISIEEVENAIDSYQAVGGFSLSPVGERLATPEFRLKLLHYTTAAIQNMPASLNKQKLPYHSLEMRLYVESCLYRGIEALLRED